MQVKSTGTIGRLYAREFRRALRARGLSFTEDKGWLDSQFIITGELSEISDFQVAWQRRGCCRDTGLRINLRFPLDGVECPTYKGDMEARKAIQATGNSAHPPKGVCHAR